MNLALGQEFNIFCEQEQLQQHATLDKNAYYIYGTLNAMQRPQTKTKQTHCST